MVRKERRKLYAAVAKCSKSVFINRLVNINVSLIKDRGEKVRTLGKKIKNRLIKHVQKFGVGADKINRSCQ
jgi:hypothetical protein